MICNIIFALSLVTVVIGAASAETNQTSSEVKQDKVKPKPKRVCYKDLGCFTDATGPVQVLDYLPEDPQKINTTFNVYTPDDPLKAHQIYYNDSTSADFIESGSSVTFVIHGFGGFGSSRGSGRFLSLRKALLTQVKYLVEVDWSQGAKVPFYLTSATNTQLVGRQVSLIIELLTLRRNVSPKNIHVIGFSLGAHVAGFAGRWCREMKGKSETIGRITALDAASPSFEGTEYHVNASDALFVDAIHTSVGTIWSVVLGNVGSKLPYGTIDFYPNQGTRQPQCKGRFFEPSCSHYAAIELYGASLLEKERCQFNSVECKSWEDFEKEKCLQTENVSQMGYFSATHRGVGVHYLKTVQKYPYCD